MTNDIGELLSQQQYKAWGETRSASENGVTKYQYTGQYSYSSDFGLMFYNARWYDPSLGRFAQADSIVPGGVQGYDRYAYVRNNPIRYIDPTGHNEECGIGQSGCHGGTYTPEDHKGSLDRVLKSNGVTLDGGMNNWTRERKYAVLTAVFNVGRKLAQTTKEIETGAEAFMNVYGAVHFQWGCGDDCRSRDKNGIPYGDEGGAFASGWQANNGNGYFLIKIATMVDNGGFRGMLHMVHELGHTYDYTSVSIVQPV